ncbi:CBS domain-containing protein [Desulforhopalus singaporensis]|uniref:CBS domain-containing protein n=1 Tax=Desulforhopalus singaporensis TaxID=91360 RepID=A0A1H0RJ30_9BACT|nr:CBS domain-containing protein [Desulforhopalus singaporensis]SDP29534.1 CBS domain-containing protein [Desulforhopalus singaporensis]
MKVKDIMEPLRNWLTPEMTLTEAINVFRATKRHHGMPVNGLVVLDTRMHLVGIVSTKDILRRLIPSHLYLTDRHHHIPLDSVRADKAGEFSCTTVDRVMTEDVRVITSDESIFRCADVFLTEQVRRLPVTRSGDGKVAGMVYLRDVYNTLTELVAG